MRQKSGLADAFRDRRETFGLTSKISLFSAGEARSFAEARGAFDTQGLQAGNRQNIEVNGDERWRLDLRFVALSITHAQRVASR